MPILFHATLATGVSIGTYNIRVRLRVRRRSRVLPVDVFDTHQRIVRVLIKREARISVRSVIARRARCTIGAVIPRVAQRNTLIETYTRSGGFVIRIVKTTTNVGLAVGRPTSAFVRGRAAEILCRCRTCLRRRGRRTRAGIGNGGRGRTRRVAGDASRAWVSDLIRGNVDDIVLVAAIIVASIDGVAGVPAACVEGTVSAKGNLILSKNVRGEEVARLVRAIRVRVGLVVICLGLACGSTQSRVVRVFVEKAHAVVGIVAIVKRRVNGCWKSCWGVEVLDSGQSLADLAVTVATSNHNLKVLTPLTLVGGSVACDRISVKRAFDAGSGSGVAAIRPWLKRRIAFEEDVEA